jgi:hypothetical protein
MHSVSQSFIIKEKHIETKNNLLSKSDIKKNSH